MCVIKYEPEIDMTAFGLIPTSPESLSTIITIVIIIIIQNTKNETPPIIFKEMK